MRQGIRSCVYGPPRVPFDGRWKGKLEVSMAVIDSLLYGNLSPVVFSMMLVPFAKYVGLPGSMTSAFSGS